MHTYLNPQWLPSRADKTSLVLGEGAGSGMRSRWGPGARASALLLPSRGLCYSTPHSECVRHQLLCSFSFSVPSEDGLMSSFALEICPQPLSVESRGARSPPTLVQFKLGMQGRRPATRGPGPKEFSGSLSRSGQCFLCDLSEQRSIGGWGLGTGLLTSADVKHSQCE